MHRMTRVGNAATLVILAVALALCAGTVGYLVGSDRDTLFCGAYTQATANLDGCEMLDGWHAVRQ